MYFKEKTEQWNKLGSLVDVINTLKKIIERQQDDEVRAIYGSSPYKLSNEYNNLHWKREKTSASVQKLQSDFRRQVYNASQTWQKTLTSNSQKKARARRTY